jgi:hypothetical protein
MLSSHVSFGTLTEAGGILAFTRKPAAEPVISLQVTNLVLVGHCVFQNTDDAHRYGRKRLILRFVELPQQVLTVSVARYAVVGPSVYPRIV